MMRISPVFLFLTTLIAALAAHLLFCLKLSAYLSLELMQAIGISLLLLALAINTLAYREFKSSFTPHAPFSKPKTLLSSGVFSYSRNPVYLALVLSQFALAFVVDTAWLLLFSFILLLLLNILVIPDEEKSLEEAFGKEYEKYKTTQRRWL